MSETKGGRVRLTVSVPRATAEQLRLEAEAHGRSVACEGGQLIRQGLEARAAKATRSGAANGAAGAGAGEA